MLSTTTAARALVAMVVASLAAIALTATASRVASGSAAVRPETRERVERAMRDLLYVAPGRTEPSGAT